MNIPGITKRRSIGILSFLLICFTSPNNVVAKQVIDKPNILLIVADDLGYEKLGSYSGLNSLTPNLDMLTEQGMLFTRAYASPVCTPSRMSIYTGTYAATHRYTTVIPVHEGSTEYVDFSERTTYAQLLKRNGYETSVTGKWQMAGLEFHPEHCYLAGFGSWCVWQIWRDGKKTKRYWNATLNEDGHIRTDIDSLFGPDVLTDYVIKKMEQAKLSNKPFCIQHNMMLPHVPIIQTPEDKEKGRQPSLDNMISYLDKQVGKLLEAMKELDIEHNTIVFFLGDNGTHATEPRKTRNGLVSGGKWTLTDGGMHVPLIINYPSKTSSNRQIPDLIDIADLFPTICELSGTKIPEDLAIDGRSFYKLIMEEGTGERNWITAGFKDDFIVFDGNWRLHHKKNKLIDCRNLPQEIEVDVLEKDALKAFNKLNPILNDLLK